MKQTKKTFLVCAVFLANLIVNLVHAQDFNPPPAVVQQPTFGVAIDENGLLTSQEIVQNDVDWMRRKRGEAQVNNSQSVDKQSRMRKVSLRRLEAICKRKTEQNEPLSTELLFLAGLQRIEYVFVTLDNRDIIVAGLAEGWTVEPDGRVLGQTTAQPVIRLEDCMTAMASCRVKTAWFGCTISPTPQGLANLVEINQALPRAIPAAERESLTVHLHSAMQEALGLATIGIFGIPANSRMGFVLVEADYRMKRIALGVEPPPVSMATFASLIRQPPRNALQRWWLTPKYNGLEHSKDRLTWRLSERGMELQTQNYQITDGGQLEKHPERVGKASRMFATAFTKKYREIANRQTVFAELRNMVDLLIVAKLLEQEDVFATVDWTPGWFTDAPLIQPKRVTPTSAACVVNVFWRGNRLLAPAGGGVSIDPQLAIGDSKQRVGLRADREKHLATMPEDLERWWWDE